MVAYGKINSRLSPAIGPAFEGRQIKLVFFCGVTKHELLSLPMMFVMNLVISTDQLHYWELVILYFMHACCVLVLFILIIVYII